MFVKPFAACGAVLLAGAAAICISSSVPVLAASEGEVSPAVSAQEGSLEPAAANPTWYQEATAGTPDQSVWRAPPGKAKPSQAQEATLPALDKPMTLLNGLFEPSRTSSFPHP